MKKDAKNVQAVEKANADNAEKIFDKLLGERFTKTIFDNNKVFKEWVEQTSLFSTLVEGTKILNRGSHYIGYKICMNNFEIILAPNHIVNTVYDLPFELVVEFWKNSPFYESRDIDHKEIKQLSDKPKTQIMHFKEFQEDVESWLNKCFGEEIAKDIVERNYRFFEEAIELVQASGMSKEQCLILIDYVYNRPDGQVEKEVGGVIVTLSALCSARNIGLGVCAVVELDRVELMTDKIREKQKNKPKDIKNPLPGTLNSD